MISGASFSICKVRCGLQVVLMPDPTRRVWFSVDEDSLSTQDMADIEDGKPLLFDEARHKRHVCREDIA